MTRCVLRPLLLCVAVCISSLFAEDVRYISFSPDWNESSWNWEGFGVSLCWWANVFGNERTDLLRAVFSLEPNITVQLLSQTTAGVEGVEVAEGGAVQATSVVVPGLGLNIARYNVGASSRVSLPNGTQMIASPNIPSWKQIESYWEVPSLWNESRDLRQRAVVDWGLTSCTTNCTLDTVEVFSNSPVWWQCANFNPSGSETGLTNNLNPEYAQSHAEYVANVTVMLRTEHRWPVTSLELFNEPSAPWWKSTGTQEGCRIGPHEQAQCLAHLPDAMRALDGAVRIAASDESFVDMALATWNAFNETTQSVIQQVNVHGYEQGGNRSGLFDAVVRHGGKHLRDSEYGDGDGTGQQLLRSLMADWHWLHPSGWCYWQAVDFAEGWGFFLGSLPPSMAQKAERPTNPWGGVIAAVNTKYYVVAQIARHIRPSMKTVVPQDSATSRAEQAAGSLAAVDESTSKVVAVIANVGPNATFGAQNVSVSLGNLLPTRYSIVEIDQNRVVEVRRYDTNCSSSTPDPNAAYTPSPPRLVQLQDGAFWISIPPLFVTTVEILPV